MLPLISDIKSRIKVEHVMLAILILAVVLRFCFLDLKLFHHDEAIHAWFSYGLMSSWSYVYDPVYHGPFLYYVTAGMFSLFGASDLVARILPCVFGCAIIPLIYWIYRMKYLSGRTACIAALFVAIAPQMVYFSRFLRNDVFVIFFSLLMVAAFMAYIQKGKWYYLALVGGAGALGLCCKENMPLIIVTFLVFFVYLWWTKRITLPKTWVRDAIIAVLIFLAIVFTLYTSFWQFPMTALTAGPDAISHWLSMHNEQRIAGPPVFYILCFILYELPILLLAVAGLIIFLANPACQRKKAEREAEKLSAETVSEETYESPEPEIQKKKFSVAKLFARPKEPMVINRENEFFRFAIYWTIIACITYGYIGEKVPWLSLHQLLPMIFVAAFVFLYLGKWWKPVLAVSAVILLAVTFYVAYTPTDIPEPIIQVQNSEDLVLLMDEMRESDKVAIAAQNGWPFMWYFRGDDWNRMTYYGTQVADTTLLSGDYDIIISHDTESYDSLKGYDKKTIRLQYWLDHWSITTVGGWINYYFTRFFSHEPIGSYNIDVFTKNTSI
ncbi:MAG: TIGR03663 family protein [Methanocorpusculum sp.]|nr:TIGR03663 family protein [Methanocorpusculum sp.]